MDALKKRVMDGNVVKFASIAAYASCSIGMIIINKSILSRFLFQNTFFLLVVQNFLALFWTLIAAKLPTLTWKRVLQWLPINVAFLLMLYTGFRGLEFLKLSMVTVLKNCTNILILAADWYLYGQTVNARVVWSLALMIIGAIAAGYNDLEFSATGYIWMSLNCVATAFYVVYMRRAMTTYDFSKNDAAVYNSILSLPMSLFVCIVGGEFMSGLHDPLWQDAGFSVAMGVAGSLGFLLGLSSFWCVKQTSPTTYSIVGTSNKALVALIGITLMGDNVTSKGILFIVLSLTGSTIYALSGKPPRPPPARPPAARPISYSKALDVAERGLASTNGSGSDDPDFARDDGRLDFASDDDNESGPLSLEESEAQPEQTIRGRIMGGRVV